MDFVLKSILSHMRILTPSFSSFTFALCVFLHPLKVYFSCALRWVSCNQHIVDSCFCFSFLFLIQSATLCLTLEHSVHWYSRLLLIYMYLLTFKILFSSWLFLLYSFIFSFVAWWYPFILCLCLLSDLCLPYFSSMLTPSYIACFRLVVI